MSLARDRGAQYDSNMEYRTSASGRWQSNRQRSLGGDGTNDNNNEEGGDRGKREDTPGALSSPSVVVRPADDVDFSHSIARIIHRVSVLPASGEAQLQEVAKESKQLILRIKGKKGYLPTTTNHHYAHKLLYLAQLPENETWLPYEEQVKVFDRSTMANRRTSFWLGPTPVIPCMLSWLVLSLC